MDQFGKLLQDIKENGLLDEAKVSKANLSGMRKNLTKFGNAMKDMSTKTDNPDMKSLMVEAAGHIFEAAHSVGDVIDAM